MGKVAKARESSKLWWGTREYNSWVNMRQRCRNQNHPKWPAYGGRGITVCARWDSFLSFLADMGPRPPGTTIDRENNDGNYEPGNCRWATATVQGRNKRNNIRIGASVEGDTTTIPELATAMDVPQDTLYERYYKRRQGATMDLATLQAPPRPNPKGEDHPRRLLSEQDVVAIRRRRAAGETQRALALEFHVSRSAIKHIVSRRNWSHVP